MGCEMQGKRRKMQIFLLLLLVFSSVSVIFILGFVPGWLDSYTYDFNWTWGGTGFEEAHCIAIDDYDNIYIAGMTNSFGAGGWDAFLAKYDTQGNLQWNVTWGEPFFDEFNGIAVDNQNNSYLFGNGVLVKFNGTGDQQWNLSLGYAWDRVEVDGNNSCYLAGGFFSDAILVKYNSTGHQVWNRTWGGPQVEFGYAVKHDNDHNCYLAGRTSSFGVGSYDAFLVKYDVNGTQLWNCTWGGAADETIDDIVIDSNNNCYLSGYTESFMSGSWASTFLVKYDPAGNQIWNRTRGEDPFTDLNDLAIDSHDNCYLAGTLIRASYDLFLVKYDAMGNELWSHSTGGPHSENGECLAVDSHDNIFIAGRLRHRITGENDALLVKYEMETLELVLSVENTFGFVLLGLMSLCFMILFFLLREQITPL